MRLERIQTEYGKAVSVSWRTFLLRPVPEHRSLEGFRRYTQSWSRPASQADAGRFRVWSTDEAPPSHSIPPNLAIKAAARQGAHDRYQFAIMHAYFWENRNVTDEQTLVNIASACTMDVARFRTDMGDHTLEAEVMADHTEASTRGISAVPTVVVDDDWQIPGAQDLDFYRRVLDRRQALREQSSGR